jgi:hypothetical protein
VQQALTVVAPVRESARAGLAGRLEAIEGDVLKALAGVPSLHFARFALIENTPGDEGGVLRLALECNHDGERAAHLAELSRALAPFEDVLFEAWAGYQKGELAAFVESHALTAATFYLGHPGLSVLQIHNDRDVRLRLEALLDEEVASGATSGATAVDLRARLVAKLSTGDALVTGPVDRGLPPQPWARLFFYLGVVPVVFVLACVFVPIALLVELWERHHEPPAKLVAEGDPRLERLNAKEDAITQNGFTHYVALRPGPFRKLTLTLVLWFLERARRNIAYEGTLGGISSIHFARWVLLGDGTVIFFSNYDGSWEAYLGDFVDKAHFYLTAVWTNTKWFPAAHALIFGGAAKESSFKQWTRTCQVENQIWYSAYKDLTVLDVLRNALLREGTTGDMNEKEAQAWLRRL